MPDDRNMRERIAKLLASYYGSNGHAPPHAEDFEVADAIFDEQREPTPEMIANARGAISGYMRAETITALWQAMLTAAKQERG